MKKFWMIVACVVCIPLLLGVLVGAGKAGGWFDKDTEEDESPPGEDSVEPHPDYMPEDILGNKKYAMYTLISFEESDKQQALGDITLENGCSSAYVNGEISSRAFSLTEGGMFSQAVFSLYRNVDITPYDGFMFYLDTTGVATPVNDKSGAALRVYSAANENSYSWTRNTDSPAVEGVDIALYYQTEDGWDKACCFDGERGQYPENYKGWIYIPFSSYITRATPDSTSPTVGIYGAESINKLMFLTGAYSVVDDVKDTVIVDEISLVKLDVNQRDWSIPDEINEYYYYDNVALAYAGGYGEYGNEPLQAGKEVIVAVTGTGDVTLQNLADSEGNETPVELSLGEKPSTRIVSGFIGGSEQLTCIGNVTLQIFAKLDIDNYSDIKVSSFMNFATNDSVVFPYKLTANVEAGKHYGFRVHSLKQSEELESPLALFGDAGVLTEIDITTVTVGNKSFDSVLYCFEAEKSGEVAFSLNTKNVKVDVYEMPYVNYDGYVYLKTDLVATPTSATVVDSYSESGQTVYNGYLVKGVSCGKYYLGNFNIDGSEVIPITYSTWNNELLSESGSEIILTCSWASTTYFELVGDGATVGDLFFGDPSLKFEDLKEVTLFRVIGTF